MFNLCLNMRTKFVLLVFFTIITTIIWIYWNSNTNSIKNKEINHFSLYNRTIFSNKHFVKQLQITPTNNNLGFPFFVIIVTSYVGHVELRSAHRRAMPETYLKKYNATRIFLLATIPESEKYIKQEAINDESKAFGDILQGKFIENYRNLTYKHLMGLHWISSHYNNTRYILKVDDDTVFNLEQTYKMLSNLKNNHSNNFLMGYILNDTKPRRNRQNKWFVTWDEYEYNNYPPYLSGWYYITTPQVASSVCKVAAYHKYFWIDDIFVTGILTESLGITLRQLPNRYWLEYYELLECCLRDMIEKNIKCTYVVGPNGGRNNLILEFNEAYKNCENKSNCVENATRSLKKECVAYRSRAIFSDGQSKIERVRL